MNVNRKRLDLFGVDCLLYFLRQADESIYTADFSVIRLFTMLFGRTFMKADSSFKDVFANLFRGIAVRWKELSLVTL